MRLFKRRSKALYPIHCYSLGYAGSKRSPMTWFACPTCGYATFGSPFEPASICEGRWAGPHEPTEMRAAMASQAQSAIAKACDGKPDLISRALGH